MKTSCCRLAASGVLRSALFCIAALGIGLEPARAVVTTVGAVNPVPPAAGGNLSSSIDVGTDSVAGGPFGSLTIDGGTQLIVQGRVTAGATTGFIGDIVVTDLGSRLAAPEIFVGGPGLGTLDVRNGGSVVTESLFIMPGFIFPPGIGTVRVSGPTSLLTTSGLIAVGVAEAGRLEIIDGGRIVSSGSENSIVSGTVIVEGPGSIWQLTDSPLINAGGELRVASGGRVLSTTLSSQPTVIGGVFGQNARATVTGRGSLWSVFNGLNLGASASGRPGSGSLAIEDEAVVQVGVAVNGIESVVVGRTSEIRLAGGRLESSLNLRNEGVVKGDGVIHLSRVEIQQDGFINEGTLLVGEGQNLKIDGNLTNRGSVAVQGGVLEVTQITTQEAFNEATAAITLADGDAIFRAGLFRQGSGGLLASIDGTNNIFGNVEDTAVLVTGESHAVFHDSLRFGSVEVTPGSTLTVLGELRLSDQNASSLGLAAGAAPAVVSGEAVLDGELNLLLAEGAAPGDRFAVLSATEGLLGEFDQINLPQVDGVTLRLETDANSISVVADLQGDYNGDGLVDVADYTVWRDALSSGDPVADGNNDGAVDTADYLAWADNFGASLPPQAGLEGAAVPEPSAALLATLLLVGLVGRRA